MICHLKTLPTKGWVFCPDFGGSVPIEISNPGWETRVFLFGPSSLPDSGAGSSPGTSSVPQLVEAISALDVANPDSGRHHSQKLADSAESARKAPNAPSTEDIPGFNEDSGKMSCVWRWVGFGWPHDSRRLSYRRGSQSADRAGSRRVGRPARDKARQT